MVIKGLYSKIKRKGVSPVIATVIIIALVVAATAMVFLVVFPMLNPDFDPILHLDRNQSNFYDYDRDGNCDLMVLRLENFGTTDTTITNMTIIAINDDDTVRTNWVPLMEENVELTSKSTKDVYLYAELDGIDEIQPGYSMNIMIWSEDLIIGVFDISNAQYTPGDSIQVEYTDGDGNPISDATLNFYYSTGEFAYSGENTNEQGLSTTYLYPGRYYASIGYAGGLYHTEIFIHPSTPKLSLQVDNEIHAKVVDADGNPIVGIWVYLFREDGTYTGFRTRTNDEGYASFSAIPLDEDYQFRVTHVGDYYWSEVFTADYGIIITMEIGGNIHAKVVDTDENPIVGIWVYLFREDGTYTGFRTRTNDTGYASFSAIPLDEDYQFRITYVGDYYWSEVFTADYGIIITMEIGGNIHAEVVDTDGNPIVGIWVHLFREDGTYTGFRTRTNDTGYASFSAIPLDEDYQFRVTYVGDYYWSEVFTADYGTVITMEIGGKIHAKVVDTDGNPIVGIWVHLFREDGTYTGFRTRTNDTGYASFSAIPLDEDYKFRVTYVSDYYWSEVFTADYGTVVTIEIGGEIHAKVVDTDGNPIVGIWVHLFREDGTYTGFRTRTNDTGYASFSAIPLDEDYQFRVTYVSNYYWSEVFTAEYGTVVTIEIGGEIHAKVVDTDGNPIVGIWVYLFREDGTYTGFRTRTNDTGYASFSAIPLDEDYQFRVTYVSNYYWSEVFTAEYGTVVTIEIGGEIHAKVVDTDENPIVGIWVHLFREDGTYTGFRTRTNDTGYASFSAIPLDEDYQFRVTYESDYYWSEVFTAEYGTVITIEIDITASSNSSSFKFYFYNNNNHICSNLFISEYIVGFKSNLAESHIVSLNYQIVNINQETRNMIKQ